MQDLFPVTDTLTQMCTYYLHVKRAEVRLTLATQRSPDIFINILEDTNPEMPTKHITDSWNTRHDLNVTAHLCVNCHKGLTVSLSQMIQFDPIW